jgi:tetratricopeptide (TPR) repeat protein
MAKSVWKLKEKVEDDIYFSAASIMVAAYLARGQYYKGLDICMRAPVLKIEKRNMGKFQMLMKIAILYDEISSLDSSYAYINKVAQSNPEPFFDVWSKFQLGQIYVSKKLPDSLKAVINDIEKTVDQRHQVFDIILPFISGLEVDHLMLTGKNKEALKLSKKLDNRAPLYLRDRYLKKEAMLLLKLKDYEEALEAGYLMQQQFVDPMNDAYNNPRSYYVLGRVYEEMGEINKARENYGKLLKLWKEAVNTIPELIDTKQRMEKLKQVQG